MQKFKAVTTHHVFIFAVLALTACGKASFDPFMSGLEDNPSLEHSRMNVTANNVADGMTPAQVTLEIRSASDIPLAGVNMTLTVTGDNNVIVPCTTTDANGLSSCKIYSTKAEQKSITAWGSINLKSDTQFTRPRFSRTMLSFVGGASMQKLASGHKIFTTTGIVETPAAQKDSNGVLRLYSSVLGSVIGDE
jgi:Bacterial Ig-like domain (group 1).